LTNQNLFYLFIKRILNIIVSDVYMIRRHLLPCRFHIITIRIIFFYLFSPRARKETTYCVSFILFLFFCTLKYAIKSNESKLFFIFVRITEGTNRTIVFKAMNFNYAIELHFSLTLSLSYVSAGWLSMWFSRF